MEMQERIDALIRMRKEKPEHHWEWNKLRNALVQEEGLLSTDEAAQLNTAFRTIQQEEQLKIWDDRFHEVLITGTFTDEYRITMDNSAYGSAVLSNGGTNASWSTAPATASAIASNTVRQTLTDEMVKAYAQYKDDYKKKSK